MPDLTGYDAAYPPMGPLLASSAIMQFAYTDGGHGYIVQQIEQFRAAGKGILPNHERGQADLLGGYPAGVLAAQEAVPNVIGWGCPADGSVTICYSVDVNVNPAQYPAVGAAFDGIRAVHGGRFKLSCYGQGALIDYLAQHGKTNAKGWLSASASYPGYNRSSPNVGAYQLVGTDIPGTDKNIITDLAGLAAWWPAGVTPSGGGTLVTGPSISDIHNDDIGIWRTAEVAGIIEAAAVAALTSQQALLNSVVIDVFRAPEVSGIIQAAVAAALTAQPAPVSTLTDAQTAAIGQQIIVAFGANLPATKADVVAALSSTTLKVGT